MASVYTPIVIPCRLGQKRKALWTVDGYSCIERIIKAVHLLAWQRNLPIILSVGPGETGSFSWLTTKYNITILERPEILARPSAPVGLAIEHAIKTHDKFVSNVIVAQVNNPLIRPTSLWRLIKSVEAFPEMTWMTAYRAPHTLHAYSQFSPDADGNLVRHPQWKYGKQKKPERWAFGGCLIVNWRKLREKPGTCFHVPIGYNEVDRWEALDIDDQEDCRTAGAYIRGELV